MRLYWCIGFCFLSAQAMALEFAPLGRFEHGEKGAAEIVVYDRKNTRLAVVNPVAKTIDFLAMENPNKLKRTSQIDLQSMGGVPTSVAVHDGVIAVAIANSNHGAKGLVALFDDSGKLMKLIEVGYHPDMITMDSKGEYILVANEGEPSDDYAADPAGSISMIHLAGAMNDSYGATVDLNFRKFDDAKLPDSVRVFGPNAVPSLNLEPEFIAFAPDNQRAFVTLQENNAVAVVDLPSQQIESILGLGFKSFARRGHGMDASDRDDRVSVLPRPVRGMYQPDGIAAFEIDGETYFITANEGDPRDYGGFSEVIRFGKLDLNPDFVNRESVQTDEQLGRLKVTKLLGDADGDGKFEEAYTFGARSFAVFRANGEIVFESGDLLERVSAQLFPDDFNSNSDGKSKDERSDDRGPEPEGVTIGKIGARTFAFLGLERTSAIIAIDVSRPTAPQFVAAYHDSRHRERGPEGLCFIRAEDSPIGEPLLAIAFEASGTTSVLQIVDSEPPTRANEPVEAASSEGKHQPEPE